MINPAYPFQIRVLADSKEYWKWASDTVGFGRWIQLIPLITTDRHNPATYCFKEEQDLLAFKLRFQIA